MRALIIAGGVGSRLRPLTDVVPKPLVEFMGEPFTFGQMRRLAAAGVDQVSFLVGPYREEFEVLVAAGRQIGVDVDFEDEEAPLDTAGAARRALRRDGDGPVLVCNGDILTDMDYQAVVSEHTKSGAGVTLALTRVEDTSAYGVVVCDPGGRVTRFVEKPAPDAVDADTVNAGTYVLNPEIFDRFPGDGPLSFERQVFPGLLNDGVTVHGVVSPAHWADLGTRSRLLAGHRAVLAGHCLWPMAPALAQVSPTVWVARDAIIHPSAELSDCVVVGAGATVGAGARVVSSAVHAGSHVGRGAVVASSIVAPGATIPEADRLHETIAVDARATF